MVVTCNQREGLVPPDYVVVGCSTNVLQIFEEGVGLDTLRYFLLQKAAAN